MKCMHGIDATVYTEIKPISAFIPRVIRVIYRFNQCFTGRAAFYDSLFR